MASVARGTGGVRDNSRTQGKGSVENDKAGEAEEFWPKIGLPCRHFMNRWDGATQTEKQLDSLHQQI